MPSAYQTFKNEMFKEIKSKYFTDYKIKEGEKIQTLVAQKCKIDLILLNQVINTFKNK